MRSQDSLLKFRSMWIISISKTTWIRGVMQCVIQSMLYIIFSVSVISFVSRDARSLDGVNTESCEQTFKWVNKFTSVKSMNESRFWFFFTVIFDLHNLQMENKLRSTANPKSPLRWENVQDQINHEPSLLGLKSKLYY